MRLYSVCFSVLNLSAILSDALTKSGRNTQLLRMWRTLLIAGVTLLRGVKGKHPKTSASIFSLVLMTLAYFR